MQQHVCICSLLVLLLVVLDGARITRTKRCNSWNKVLFYCMLLEHKVGFCSLHLEYDISITSYGRIHY